VTRGHGDKLTRRQELAIAALLAHPTLAPAAEAIGVNEKTLRQWMRIPEFKAAYAQARMEILDRTVARLLESSGQAIDTLLRNLTCADPGPEIRAAVAILDHARRGVEVLDLAAEVADLREQLEVMRRGPERRSEPAPERNGAAANGNGLHA
jgi:hypothetical protein